MVPVDINALLDEASIIAEARQRSGLQVVGNTMDLAPLVALLKALREEARLTEAGALGQRQRLVELLINRARVADALTKHPEILDEVIADPVAIVGLPRTGTTLLHRIMASDTRFFAPYWYEVRNPAPFPGWDFTGKDPRITDAEVQVALMLEHAPDLMAVHPLTATGADEEIMLLEHSFYSTMPEAFANVPSFGRWLEEHDNTPGYRYLKVLLQFLQWQKKRLGQSGQRWLLKTPHHLHHMSILLKVFPDITIIQTHRDPLQTIPSICSFHHILWRMASDDVDPVELARQWSGKFARGMTHTMAVRDLHPASFIDVRYQDTVTQPLVVMADVYQHLGMELTSEARAAMQAWQAENARDNRAAHEYTLAQFGLTEPGLKAQFADYRRRYILAG